MTYESGQTKKRVREVVEVKIPIFKPARFSSKAFYWEKTFLASEAKFNRRKHVIIICSWRDNDPNSRDSVKLPIANQPKQASNSFWSSREAG